MPPLHDRIDALVQQADQLRGAIHKELDVLRCTDMVRRTRYLRDVPGHLIEAEACIDRAMDDLCAAAAVAERSAVNLDDYVEPPTVKIPGPPAESMRGCE